MKKKHTDRNASKLLRVREKNVFVGRENVENILNEICNINMN